MPAEGSLPPERRADPAPAVRCEGLVVRYGARTAVDHVSFTVGYGEVLCILGPNGAGKTSTVECLEGYRRPASGTVSVLGLDPVAEHRGLVKRIGVMLQRGGMYQMLAPRRALRLFASYYEHPADPDELLDLVRLRKVARTPWRHLSGGEQARLSLALALVGRPEVLLLDEPTAGVDPEGRIAVRGLVRAARDEGTGVLLTTHELTEAERLADRVLVLAHGAVAAEGSPTSLMGEAGVVRQVAFGAPPGLHLEELRVVIGTGATVTEEEPGRYRVKVSSACAPDEGDGSSTATTPGALAASVATWLAGRGVEFRDLRVGRSLEEAYLEVLRTHDGRGEARGEGRQ
ncbi:MAG: ABC transporter ATP-binding protein [Acidimicrobiales bacterium]